MSYFAPLLNYEADSSNELNFGPINRNNTTEYQSTIHPSHCFKRDAYDPFFFFDGLLDKDNSLGIFHSLEPFYSVSSHDILVQGQDQDQGQDQGQDQYQYQDQGLFCLSSYSQQLMKAESICSTNYSMPSLEDSHKQEETLYSSPSSSYFSEELFSQRYYSPSMSLVSETSEFLFKPFDDQCKGTCPAPSLFITRETGQEKPNRNLTTVKSKSSKKKTPKAKSRKVLPILKKFKCDYCPYASNRLNNTNRHAKKHTDEVIEKSPCDVCSKSYSSRSNMLRHKKLHHI
ncbi:C2H2-type zinc finger transcription factor [Phycomyces blakesleeanus]